MHMNKRTFVAVECWCDRSTRRRVCRCWTSRRRFARSVRLKQKQW